MKAVDTTEIFYPHAGKWTKGQLGSDETGRPYCFTVVRNPYSRILSGYLDKIVRPGILREQFYIQHGLKTEEPLSFRKFLECLASKPAILDQHYRPQVQNIYFGYIDLDMIWPLETLDSGLAQLALRFGAKIEASKRGTHTTSASTKLMSYFDSASVELTRHLYAEDFEAFGYSEDPLRASEAVPPQYDVVATEEGWFDLLSQDALGNVPNFSSAPTKRQKFYADIAVAKMYAESERDASQLLAFLSEDLSIEKEQYVLNSAVMKLSEEIVPSEILLAMSERLVEIAPYVIDYRLKMIELLRRTGGPGLPLAVSNAYRSTVRKADVENAAHSDNK